MSAAHLDDGAPQTPCLVSKVLPDVSLLPPFKSFSVPSPSSSLTPSWGLTFPRTRAEAHPFLLRFCSCPGFEEPGEELGGFPASSGPSPHFQGTWPPAPGTWCGQREEEASFPGHSPWLFLSSSPIIFSGTLKWIPLISGGFPILRLRGSLRHPLRRTQDRKSVTAAKVGMGEEKAEGAPILQTPSGI